MQSVGILVGALIGIYLIGRYIIGPLIILYFLGKID